MLSGLGFSREDWKRRTEEFSGGWQMRIALAKLLLEKPNLLLLDEPTNHLDLEARNWLEDYLNQYPYAFVLVSHDRYFLDVTVKKVVELWNKRAHVYTGNYSRYEELKTEKRAQLEAAYRNQRERSRAARSLHQPLPRPGHQGQAGAEPHQRAGADRAHRDSAGRKNHPFPLSAAQAQRPRGGGVPRRGQELWRQAVFSGVNFIIERGDRVALVGVNGAGKSTLIKILAGAEPVTAGEYTLGHNAQPDYFAQDQYKGAGHRRAHPRRSGPRSRRAPPTPSCAAFWAAFCFPRTTSSSPSACFPAASATATRWRACS